MSGQLRSTITSADRRDVWWDAALVVLLASTAAVVLAVPTFPTQDGPVHLYYTDVLRGLLTHRGPFQQYFGIKTLLTPYALEYYVLLALEMVFSPPMSEKLLLCGYIFAFGWGFRYLVGAAGGSPGPWTLASIPFCMHLLVYLGFLNYCFGIALLFFLSGYWLRHAERLAPGQIATLLGGLILMLLTHAVTAAVFLLFLGLYFAAALVEDALHSRQWLASLVARRRQMVLVGAMGVAAIAWIAPFLDRSPRTPSPPAYFKSMGWAAAVLAELQLRPAMPFTGILYRAGPMVLLVLTALALGWTLWRRPKRVSPAVLALVAAGSVCFLLFCIVPLETNGSWNFPERFPILWIAFFIAAAGASRPSRAWSIAVGATAVLVTGGVLIQQWLSVSEMAGEIAGVMRAAPAKTGSVGLIVGRQFTTPPDLAFDPYMWAAAGYFRRDRTILANTPWMDSPIIVLKPLEPDRFSYLNPAESSQQLEEMYVGQERPSALDFVVQNPPFDDGMALVLKRLGFAGVSDEGFVRIFRRSP